MCRGRTFLAPGQSLSIPEYGHDVQLLSDAEIVAILDEMPPLPMLAGNDGLRLLLVGAQDKLPVVFDGDRIGLPKNGTLSSPILKPAIRTLADTVINEGFCLALSVVPKNEIPELRWPGFGTMFQSDSVRYAPQRAARPAHARLCNFQSVDRQSRGARQKFLAALLEPVGYLGAAL